MRLGLVTSVPVTLDAFFVPWAAEWLSQGVEVHTASGPGPVPKLVSSSHTVISGLTRKPSVTTPRARARLREWEVDRNLDVILTNTATASFIVRTSKLASPIVYFCHGLHWSPTSRNPLPKFLERKALRGTSAIICMNESDRQWFTKRTSLPLLYLESGVGLELDRWLPQPWIQPAMELNVVWVGEFSPRKRPSDAIQVFRLLRQAGVNARLTFVGDGALRNRIERMAQPLNDIRFVGQVDPRPFLSDAHLLLSTSAWEGNARVLLEAAATQRPAFGYDTKGVRDVPGCIAQGVPGDSKVLADAIINWLESGAPWKPTPRASLDWRQAHAQVSNFVGRVVAPS